MQCNALIVFEAKIQVEGFSKKRQIALKTVNEV